MAYMSALSVINGHEQQSVHMAGAQHVGKYCISVHDICACRVGNAIPNMLVTLYLVSLDTAKHAGHGHIVS